MKKVFLSFVLFIFVTRNFCMDKPFCKDRVRVVKRETYTFYEYFELSEKAPVATLRVFNQGAVKGKGSRKIVNQLIKIATERK